MCSLQVKCFQILITLEASYYCLGPIAKMEDHFKIEYQCSLYIQTECRWPISPWCQLLMGTGCLWPLLMFVQGLFLQGAYRSGNLGKALKFYLLFSRPWYSLIFTSLSGKALEFDCFAQKKNPILIFSRYFIQVIGDHLSVVTTASHLSTVTLTINDHLSSLIIVVGDKSSPVTTFHF